MAWPTCIHSTFTAFIFLPLPLLFISQSPLSLPPPFQPALSSPLPLSLPPQVRLTWCCTTSGLYWLPGSSQRTLQSSHPTTCRWGRICVHVHTWTSRVETLCMNISSTSIRKLWDYQLSLCCTAHLWVSTSECVTVARLIPQCRCVSFHFGNLVTLTHNTQCTRVLRTEKQEHKFQMAALV